MAIAMSERIVRDNSRPQSQRAFTALNSVSRVCLRDNSAG